MMSASKIAEKREKPWAKPYARLSVEKFSERAVNMHVIMIVVNINRSIFLRAGRVKSEE